MHFPLRAFAGGTVLVLVVAFRGAAAERTAESERPAERQAVDETFEYHPPEFHVDTEQFVSQATRFLEQHPKAVVAPRAAFDLLMFATVAKNKELADAALARLVFDYSSSLPTAYLLTTYGQNHGPFKAVLQAYFKKHAGDVSPDFGRKYCRAVELGRRHWGPGFVSGDDFLLEVAVAAQAGGVFNLELFAREKLREAGEDARRIAEIGLDPRISALDKFLGQSGKR